MNLRSAIGRSAVQLGDAPNAAVAAPERVWAGSRDGDRFGAAGGLTPRLILMLALLTAVGPFATDMYLSSFPKMVHELSTTSTAVQLSLTAFMIGGAFGQLLFGPLSDRVGRVRPLIGGCLIYTVTGTAAALAPTIEALIAIRLIQGMAAASGMAITRAIVRDLSSDEVAARTFSMLQLVSGVVIVGAPLSGSLLAGPIGWRGILGVVAGVGAFATLIAITTIPETNPPARRARRRARPQGSRASLRVLRRRSFVTYSAVQILAFATLIAYVSASPFVYQKLIGLTTIQNGLAFGLNGTIIALVSGYSARLTRRRPVRRTARDGLLINFGAVLLIAALVFTGAPVWTLALPISCSVGSVGLIFGNATALSLTEIEPHNAGLASGAMGFAQSIVAGCVAPLVGVGGEHTAVPLAIVMLGASALALVAFRLAGAGSAAAPASRR